MKKAHVAWKVGLAIAAMLVVVVPNAASAAKPASTSTVSNPLHLVTPGELIVGMTLQFKPEMYLDAKNQAAGYDVELVKLLARQLRLKLVIKNMDFNGLIPGLVSKQFDMVSVGLTNTPVRGKSILFAREYMPYATVLAAKVGDKTPSTFEAWNAAGKKITALQGSTAAGLVKTTFPNATLGEFSDQTAAFLEVASGRADGIVVEANLAGEFEASNPGKLANVALPKLIAVGYGSWAVQLGNTSLKNRLNVWLCSQQGNGTLAKLHLKTMGYKLPALPATCNR
jgi:ABC-type amino acid transport substrate-binding protein